VGIKTGKGTIKDWSESGALAVVNSLPDVGWNWARRKRRGDLSKKKEGGKKIPGGMK